MELPGTNNTTNIQSQTDGISDKETFLYDKKFGR